MKYESSFQVPHDGLAGLKHHWRKDLSSGFSVFLISLPFCLGTSLAAGFPVLSGLITAGVGALLVTFLSGSHLTIKGPTTALAAILFSAFLEYSHYTENPYRYVAALVILSGFLQVLMGVLNFSKWRDIIPDSVIFGVIAGLGLIVLAEQIHLLFGLNIYVRDKNLIVTLIEIPSNFFKFEFKVFFIGVISLILLFSLFSFNLVVSKFLPSPFLVLFVGLLFSLYFGFAESATLKKILLETPTSLTQTITFFDFSIDFSKIFSWTGFKYALSLALVGSLESLLNVKSIDALDIYRRKTKNNRELIALGVGNMVCGALGALPMIATMVRSASNINNGGETRWSNFFHGFFLLIFGIAFFYAFAYIPKVSVAAIVIYTAYRLNSPKLLKDIYLIGREQLAMFLISLLATLIGGALLGILMGVLTTAVIYLLLGAPLSSFFRINKQDIRIIQYDSSIKVTLRSPALSFNYPILAQKLKVLVSTKPIYIDLMRSKLVTHSFMELIHYHTYNFNPQSGGIEIQGLDDHVPLSEYPLATRRKIGQKSGYSEHPAILNERQIDIFGVASINNAKLLPQLTYDGSKLQGFSFALGYEIKYRENKFRKKYRDAIIEFSDILLSRGIRMSEQSYKMSIVIISDLEVKLPEFNLEKEGLLAKFYQSFGYENIEFTEYPQFSERYFLTAPDENTVRTFFNERLILFLLKNKHFNIESRNNKLLLFVDKSLMTLVEIELCISFSESLIDILYNKKSTLETSLMEIFHIEEEARREILEKLPVLEFHDERQLDILGVASVNNSSLKVATKNKRLSIEKFNFAENYNTDSIENEFTKRYQEAVIQFADLRLQEVETKNLLRVSVVLIQNLTISLPDFQLYKRSDEKILPLKDNQIEIGFEGGTTFAQAYCLYAAAELAQNLTQKIFAEEVLTLFEEYNFFNIECMDNILLIYYNRELMEKTQMEDCLDFSEKFLNLLYQKLGDKKQILFNILPPIPPQTQ